MWQEATKEELLARASLEGFEPTTRCLEGSWRVFGTFLRICSWLNPEP